MTAIVAVQVVAVSMCRIRSGFSPIKKFLGRTEMRTCERKERQSVRTVDISPETIEQELQPVDCEQRQTDIFKENYNNIDCNAGCYLCSNLARSLSRSSVMCLMARAYLCSKLSRVSRAGEWMSAW